MDKFLVFSSSVLLLCANLVSCQLVVNVKNKGGDVLVESIQANTTEDTVTLEYQNTDGTLITQFIDFKSVNNFYCRNTYTDCPL